MICTRQMLPAFTGNKTVRARGPCDPSGIGKKHKLRAARLASGRTALTPPPGCYWERVTSPISAILFFGDKDLF